MPSDLKSSKQKAVAGFSEASLNLDPLTGFHQQDYLNEVLGKSIQSNRQAPVAVSLALLQLENFYEIRTWLGKSEATLFLSDIARLVKKTLPSSVLLSRCERYEFAALLFDQSSKDAREIAAKVRSVVESAARKALPDKLRLKIGIGIAEIDSRTTNNDVIYARARHDMSAFKKGQPLSLELQKNLQPEMVFHRLKQALESGLLRLSFQAVVSLKSDKLEHYEMRTHAEDSQGIIPADLLFEIAVQNAWGEAIDRWLIQNAIKAIRQCARPSLRLTVSLTHNSVVSPGFFPWLDALLKKHAEIGGQLIFQISEIDVLIAQHHMGYFCQQLSNHDIQLCINHFGCTDDPFRYLNLLRAEFVKLDSSTLTVSNQQGPEALTGLVERLHDNGLRVIVGKVEKMIQMPQLWSCNVNYVQGHGLHRPSKSLNYDFMEETTLTLH